MTDPDILREMIARTEQAYRLPPGDIINKGTTDIEIAAQFVPKRMEGEA